MVILLDAMGGDNAPEATIKGAVKAIEQIEHAKLTKVICEFGMSDKYN